MPSFFLPIRVAAVNVAIFIRYFDIFALSSSSLYLKNFWSIRTARIRRARVQEQNIGHKTIFPILGKHIVNAIAIDGFITSLFCKRYVTKIGTLDDILH